MSRVPCWRRISPEATAVVAILLGPAQPAWVFKPEAGATIRALWDASVAAQQERVACLAGTVGPDTVMVTAERQLEPGEADSLTRRPPRISAGMTAS